MTPLFDRLKNNQGTLQSLQKWKLGLKPVDGGVANVFPRHLLSFPLLLLFLLLLLASRHQFTLLGALHSSGREEPRPHQRPMGARDQKNRRATGARNETATDYGMILGAVDLLLLLLVLMVLAVVRIMVDMVMMMMMMAVVEPNSASLSTQIRVRPERQLIYLSRACWSCLLIRPEIIW